MINYTNCNHNRGITTVTSTKLDDYGLRSFGWNIYGTWVAEWGLPRVRESWNIGQTVESSVQRSKYTTRMILNAGCRYNSNLRNR